MNIIVVDSGSNDRRQKMALPFGDRGYIWRSLSIVRPDGRLAEIGTDPVLILCHTGQKDDLGGLTGEIARSSHKIYFGGDGDRKVNLLRDLEKDVIVRDIVTTGFLTTGEAEELLKYAEWRTTIPEKPSIEALEERRPDLLRRGVLRRDFLRQLRILCEGYRAAGRGIRIPVTSAEWWLQGLPKDLKESLWLAWPQSESEEDGRAVAALVSALDKRESIDSERVNRAYTALGRRLGVV